MENLKKNSTKIRNILFVAVAAVLVIINFIYLGQSFYFENDGWGTDMEFSNDYIAMLICTVTILVYSVICLVRNNENTENAYHVTFGLVGFLLAFYPLGVFFKGLAKHKAYVDIQKYLYLSIFGLVFLAYIAFHYLASKEEK